MKRVLTILLALVVVLSLLAGCNNSSASSTTAASNSGSTTTAAGSTEKTELSLWHYFGTPSIQTLFQEYVDDYNKSQDKSTVKVTILPFADFKKQLSISAAAESLPDIVFIDNCDTVAYAAMGMFADLTEQVKDWPDINDYFPQILKTCKYEDKIYALPSHSNNLAIYYNVDMMKAAGQTPPKTFEELPKVAKALTNSDTYGFAFSAVMSEEGTFQYIPFHWSNGGESMKIDSQEGIETMTLFANMVKDGSMPKEVVSWTQGDLPTQFAAGKIAMMVMGTWRIDPLHTTSPDLNWDVAPLPYGKSPANVYGGENLAVVKGKHVDESFDFLSWFLNFERSKKWNLVSNEFPARNSTMKDADFVDAPYWKTFIEMIPDTRARDVTPAWPEISVGYQTALQNALTLQKTPEEALKEGQAIIDAALKK